MNTVLNIVVYALLLLVFVIAVGSLLLISVNVVGRLFGRRPQIGDRDDPPEAPVDAE